MLIFKLDLKMIPEGKLPKSGELLHRKMEVEMEAELTRKMEAELIRQMQFFVIFSRGSNSQPKQHRKNRCFHRVAISSQ